MKRTFLAKRNNLLSFTDISWGISALAFALVILLVRLLAPNFFWYVFTPVFRAADAAAQRSHVFFSSFGNTATLAMQNEKLQEENATLSSENKALVQKARETSSLSSGILAGVVARPPESPYDTLLLAVGANDGVIVGMEAFGTGGVPLGIVSSVLSDFSRVTLFSAPNFVTSGWVGLSADQAGGASIPLTLQGAGAGALNATVARSAAVKIGDTVFAPGPGMLPIGQVVRIDTDPLEPGITLRIQPTLNLFSIGWVTLRDTGTAFSLQATSTLP